MSCWNRGKRNRKIQSAPEGRDRALQGIIIVLFIIWIVSRFNNKSKKATKSAPKKEDAPTMQRAKTMPERKFRKVSDDEPDAEQIGPIAFEESQEGKSPQDCSGDYSAHEHGEGFSRYDEEGCIGGSMEHSHEGPERPIVKRKEPTSEPTEKRQSRRIISAQEMRQAVITSEILRAPLALRGRTARR